MKSKSIIIPILIVIILTGFFLYQHYFPPYQFPDLTRTPNKIINIPRGTSFNRISLILDKNGILKERKSFLLLGKLTGYQHKIKAGHLVIPENLPPWHLLKYLTQPQFATQKVTIPEGLRAVQIAAILKAKLGLDSLRFMRLVFDTQFVHSLGVAKNVENLEGYLLPETYYFPLEAKEEQVLKILTSRTLNLFEADSVKQALNRWEMSPHEILTLASIIEGEVMVDSERVIVGSVYHNRLKKGWRLQADPTIQYILPGHPRRLYIKDLEIDSPYNTYKYRGLPPGPINNPGKKSILAALFPARTRYLFFVATGDGGHYFSITAAEHSRNKAKFDLVRKKVKK